MDRRNSEQLSDVVDEEWGYWAGASLSHGTSLVSQRKVSEQGSPCSKPPYGKRWHCNGFPFRSGAERGAYF